MVSVLKLKKFRQEKKFVSISRESIDSNSILGFILEVSKELLLIQFVYDFNLDSLMVLPISDISEVESNSGNRLQKQMLVEENIFQKIDYGTRYHLDSWKSILSQFKEQFKFVILENEKLNKPVFLIGEMKSLFERSVAVRYFSVTGRWDEKPTKISYSEITSCQVNSNYLKMYQRYFARIARTKKARRG
jgi:hypothetical protein